MRFARMNKAEKERLLPELFDILYENMAAMDFGGMTYADARARWLGAVSPALEKAPRQVVLCLVGEEIVGFAQYYTRGELLMVEEVQLRRAYRGTTAFFRLCRYLAELLPGKIAVVEAYASKENQRSAALMKRLGMELLDEGESPFLHFRGDGEIIRKCFGIRVDNE